MFSYIKTSCHGVFHRYINIFCRPISENSEEIYLPLMRETGVEVSVLRTPSNVAVLTAWLSRLLKLDMIA